MSEERRKLPTFTIPELRTPKIDSVQDVRARQLKNEQLELQNEILRQQIASEAATQHASRQQLASEAAIQHASVLAAVKIATLPAEATGRLTGHWQSTTGAVFRAEDFQDRIKISSLSRQSLAFDARRFGDGFIELTIYGPEGVEQYVLKQTDDNHVSLAAIKYSAKDAAVMIERKAAKAMAKPIAVWIRIDPRK